MKKEDLFNIIDGIDDDIILDVPMLNVQKPTMLTIQNRVPFWRYVSVAAGFVCVLAVGIFAVVKLHGGITTSLPVENSTPVISEPITSVPAISEPGTTSEPEKTGPYYDDVFKEFMPVNPSVGAPMTYDDVVSTLKPDPGQPEWDFDSLFLVETVKVLTPGECQALKGYDKLYSSSDRTMYEVKVIKDLISGETLNRHEYFYLNMGSAERQFSGDPVYAPGERFTVPLSKRSADYDFLRAPAAYALCYDSVETEDGTMLYFRWDKAGSIDFPGSENIDETVITSTTQNPAVYTQKISLEDLTGFLRADWEQKGISSHFESESASRPANPEQEPNTYFDTEHVDYPQAKEIIKFVDVKAPSDEENGIHGYEIEYAMPSKTPVGVVCEFVYGGVHVRDNRLVTIAPSSERHKRIEYQGKVFWKEEDMVVTVIYISDDEAVSYTAYFMTETQAIEAIMSLL